MLDVKQGAHKLLPNINESPGTLPIGLFQTYWIDISYDLICHGHIADLLVITGMKLGFLFREIICQNKGYIPSSGTQRN